ncbi:MAG: hypothetical protein PHU85_01980 [Phycisphaerae bacterium]|nr:hypothetical protein [Phycisphaerae bacterium]
MNFHEFTNADGEVLIVRRIPQNRTTYNDFVWPSGIGAVVEVPDWNPSPVCGGGLHGWPWGFGIGDGCDFDIIEDIWLVVGAKPEDVIGEIDLGAKCKVRRCTIRMEGDFLSAMQFVQDGFASCVTAMAKEMELAGYNAHGSVAGYNAHGSVAGNNAHGSVAGNNAKGSVAGYNAHGSVAGNNARGSVAGDNAQGSVAGNNARGSVAGDNARGSVAGDYAQGSVAGDYAQGSVAGNNAKGSVAGYNANCEARGENTVAAIAGTGRIRVGKRGAFAVAYYIESDGWRFLTGKVGEDGIEADVWYVVRDGKLCREATE